MLSFVIICARKAFFLSKILKIEFKLKEKLIYSLNKILKFIEKLI